MIEHPTRLAESLAGKSVLAEGIRAARRRLPDGAQLGALQTGVESALAVKAGLAATGPWFSTVFAKVGIVALLAGGATTAYVFAHRGESPARPPTTETSRTAGAPPSPNAAPTPAQDPVPTGSILPTGPLPRAEEVLRAPVPKASRKKSSESSRRVSAQAAPDEETRLLEQAHALLAHDPGRAAALIDEHQVRFPHSPLNEEREVIAVSALVLQGKHGEARIRAERFLAAHPHSAHRSRIEKAMAAGNRP